jgi:hypothetical protein
VEDCCAMVEAIWGFACLSTDQKNTKTHEVGKWPKDFHLREQPKCNKKNLKHLGIWWL